jgi:hypothetical protein
VAPPAPPAAPPARACTALTFDQVNPQQVAFGQTITVTAHLTNCSSQAETLNITYADNRFFDICHMPSWSVNGISLRPGESKGVSSTRLAPGCGFLYILDATVTNAADSSVVTGGTVLFQMFNAGRD